MPHPPDIITFLPVKFEILLNVLISAASMAHWDLPENTFNIKKYNYYFIDIAVLDLLQICEPSL